MTTFQLNPDQIEAVEHLSGPLLVLAGAGSGKTRVVTQRIVHLIENGLCPSHILGLTFTNKAAGEMKERVRRATNCHVLISTFHSLGARILRESIEALGYTSSFNIYDEEDSEKLLKACLDGITLYDKKNEFKVFRELISKAKNALLMPGDITQNDPDFGALGKLFPEVYSYYQSRLKESNALDFDDLLFLTARLFREHPDVLAMYQKRWRYLLIDEYQDTNFAQYEMVKLLAAKEKNLFVVGDPDQSIYSWRGASITNILNFEKDYPGAKVIRLEQNYRSHGNILHAANTLIRNNFSRFEKNLWSSKGAGEKIKFFTALDEKAEAIFVINKMLNYHSEGIPLNEMVIFYRTNFQSRVFEDFLLRNRIPYTIVGGISFYHRREVKDILAFLRMVQTSADFVAFTRTLNLPKRGIGPTTLEKLRLAAIQECLPIFDYCKALAEEFPLKSSVKLSAKVKESLKEYVQIISNLKQIAKAGDLAELVKAAIYNTHYLDVLKEEKDTFLDRKANVEELIAKAYEWQQSAEDQTLAAFLCELSLKSTLDETSIQQEHIKLMTLHNGKGLEFELAFLVGMEEDILPHVNSKDNSDQLEEERRLCYVGITRAKKYLYISHARQRFLWGTTRYMKPSRFLAEIPKDLCETVYASRYR